MRDLQTPALRAQRRETDAVAVALRDRCIAHLARHGLPHAGVEVLQHVQPRRRVAGARARRKTMLFAGRRRTAIEIHAYVVQGLRALQIQFQPVAAAARTGGAPERFVGGAAVDRRRGRKPVGRIAGADRRALRQIARGRRQRGVQPGLCQHRADPRRGRKPHLLRRLQCQPMRGQHLHLRGTGIDHIRQGLHVTAGRVVQHVRQTIDGESQMPVQVQRIALWRGPAVAAPVAVPDDAQVAVAVAQAVGGEMVPTDVDGIQLDQGIAARAQAHRILDHSEVGGAELGVVDPRAIADAAAIGGAALRPELVLVRIAVVAVDVVRPRVPVQQLAVAGRIEVRARVITQHAAEQAERHGGIDHREIVAAAGAPRLRVGLVGGVERKQRELPRIGEQAQGTHVLGVVVGIAVPGHQADAEGVVVVGFLPVHRQARPIGLALLEQVAVQAHAVGLCTVVLPQHIEHGAADLRRQRLHAHRGGGVAGQLRGLCSGQRVGVHVRALAAVHARCAMVFGPVEGHRVGVVAGHRRPVVFDQAVAVAVVGAQQRVHVVAGVARQLPGDRRRPAVHLVGAPGGGAEVLRVGIGPVLRRAGIVHVLAAAGGLAGAEPGAVGVERIAQVLEVVDEHAGGEHDGVVVAEHAFDRHRELVVVAGHRRVEEIEAQQPPAIEQGLVEIVLGRVQVRQVVGPPAVVGDDVIAIGLLRRLRGDAPVFLQRGRQLARDQPQLHLQRRRGAVRRHRQRPRDACAIDREAVAGEPRKQRGDGVVGDEGAGQLGTVGMRGHRRDRTHGQRMRRAVGAGHGDFGHRHVLFADELEQLQAHAATGIRAAEIARRLPPLRAVFDQRDRHAVALQLQAEQRVVAGLVHVGHVADEARLLRLVRVQVGGAAAGEKPVVAVAETAAGALPREQSVDPEIATGRAAGTRRQVGGEYPLQLALPPARRERHAAIRQGMRITLEVRHADRGIAGLQAFAVAVEVADGG
ncbi:hypothetical protein NB713_002766 [Xanthomonas sacchari]|nr:hypothetical protein [Xanthomonas sacchari]